MVGRGEGGKEAKGQGEGCPYFMSFGLLHTNTEPVKEKRDS